MNSIQNNALRILGIKCCGLLITAMVTLGAPLAAKCGEYGRMTSNRHRGSGFRRSVNHHRDAAGKLPDLKAVIPGDSDSDPSTNSISPGDLKTLTPEDLYGKPYAKVVSPRDLGREPDTNDPYAKVISPGDLKMVSPEGLGRNLIANMVSPSDLIGDTPFSFTAISSLTAWLQAEPPVPSADPMMDPMNSDPEYGEEPVDNSLQFLRTSSVLLDPGVWQFDYGLVYSIQEFDFPVHIGGLPARADLRRRSLVVPFAIRYGLTERAQLYTNIPVGWGHTELATPASDTNQNDVGIGDITLGVNYLLRDGDAYCPDVILTLQATLPTSVEVFPFLSSTTLSDSLGTGVWAASANMLFIQTYDPVVVFYGVGYRYQFEETIQGAQVQYGQQISYQLGVGFAVNDRVTLSTAFLGLFQTETQVNGMGLPNSTLEPLRLRFALTAFRNCHIVEPFAEIGMTDTAPAARVGIVYTH